MTIRELMEEQRKRVRSRNPAERLAAALLIPAELSKRLRRKRTFALDFETYKSLQLIAEREQSTPEQVATRLFEFAIHEQDLQTAL